MTEELSVRFSWIERSIRRGQNMFSGSGDRMGGADSLVRGVPEDDEEEQGNDEDAEEDEDQGEGYSE